MNKSVLHSPASPSSAVLLSYSCDLLFFLHFRSIALFLPSLFLLYCLLYLLFPSHRGLLVSVRNIGVYSCQNEEKNWVNRDSASLLSFSPPTRVARRMQLQYNYPSFCAHFPSLFFSLSFCLDYLTDFKSAIFVSRNYPYYERITLGGRKEEKDRETGNGE